MDKNLVEIREVTDNDRSFILATWLRGLYYGCDWFNQIPKRIFMTEYHKLLTHILTSRADVKIRIACLKEDPDIILGYSVTGREDTVIHWVFVKTGWRKMGIAKSLLPDTISSASHITKVGMDILRKHPTIVFNPFLI